MRNFHLPLCLRLSVVFSVFYYELLLSFFILLFLTPIPIHSSISSKAPVPGVSGYPLRPEMIESAFLLFSATNDPAYLVAGKQMMHNIINYTRVECGFAAVTDVLTKKLEDRFDSFFLSETCKYLYLLFDPDASVRYNNVLFTTEGHLIPLKYKYHNPEARPTPSNVMCKNLAPPRDAPLFPTHYVSHETTKTKNTSTSPSSSTPKSPKPPQQQKYHSPYSLYIDILYTFIFFITLYFIVYL